MKKNFLFAILAFSMNAFAQNSFTTVNLRHAAFNPKEIVKAKLDDEMIKSPGKNSRIDFDADRKQQHLNGQRSLIQINDSIYYWNWDTDNYKWELNNKDISIIYNNNNYLTSYMKMFWTGTAWINSAKHTYVYDARNNLIRYTYADPYDSAHISEQYIYTYDANNNLTSELIKNNWNNWVLENYQQYIYAYDTNNNRTSKLSQHWYNGAWVNYSLYTYTYDANNNLIDDLSKYWTGVTWGNNYHGTYAYDSNNNLVSHMLIEWDNSFHEWKNFYLLTYSYNTDNYISSELRQDWTDSIWDNRELNTYTYDTINNKIQKLYQESMWGGDWQDHSLYTYTYDANNNLLSDLRESHYTVGWHNAELYTYTYDINNNQTGNLYQTWDEGAWSTWTQYIADFDANNFIKSESYKYVNQYWKISGDSSFYYFHSVLGTDDLPVQDQSLTIYPNPSSGIFTISSKSQITSVEIYNLFGERIYSDFNFNIKTIKAFDLSGSPKGIYFVKVQNGTKGINKKIVIH